MEKPADNTYPVLDIIRSRWSPRAFAPRSIDAATLASLFEAARWAPSSRNQQPWRFIVARREDEAAFHKLLGVLMEGNQRWAKNAGVLLLAVAYKPSPSGSENKNARHDLGQAVAYLSLQATAMGLSLRQMGGIYPEQAQAAYNIPDDYEVLNAIAIGYAADANSLPEDLRDKEHAPRSRQPLDAFVFDAWQQPAALLDEAQTAERLHE